MGCSSSREVAGGVVLAPAERRQGLRSRCLPTRAASALTTLAMCRSELAGAVRAYIPLLPSEEAANGGAIEGAAAAVMAMPEDAALPLPPALDLDPAILLGSDQPVEVPSLLSHPALLYPEQEKPAPPPPPPLEEEDAAEKTCYIEMGTPAARDIPEVVTDIRVAADKLKENMEKKMAPAAAAGAEEEEAPGFVVGAAGDVTAPPTKILRPPQRAGNCAVVLYFTSLRGVRRTFEDCRAVRAILRCYGVRLDERDVSMHAAFKSELRSLLLLAGAGGEFEGPALPRVFVGGRHDLGGVEEVRALHESGELARALAGCDAAPAAAGWPGHVGTCAACGEARFVPCGTCRGSRKLFVDDEGCRFAGFFRQCPDCNENGLIRCPVCCY